MRKREYERIERENHAFAKRLFSNKGNIKKSNFDEHFEKHEQHRSRIQRKFKTLNKGLVSGP